MSAEKKEAFTHSIPVMLGYLPLGLTFGVLFSQLGYHWILAIFMSVVIYAGSGQFLAVSFFAAKAGYVEIGLMTFLLNSRHVFFGLSLLKKFQNLSKRIKSYLIFALTDETFAILTSRTVPEHVNKEKYYFWLSLFNHSYWIIGSALGAIGGSLLKIDTRGMDFSLTALFVVLTIEQYYSKKQKLPFVVAFLAGMAALFTVSGKNMLLTAITASIFIILLIGRRNKQWS